jgi:transcription antitermination factor NusG
MEWYALHCKSSQERIVVDKLGREGIEAFYPHLVEQRKDPSRKDGVRKVERKFFPGYAFARFDLLHSRPVIEIPQVVGIVGCGRYPVALSEFEVAAVSRIVNTPQVKAVESCPYVSAGDRVRVVSGPLAGLEGFVAYAKSGARVIVSVAMLHRSISAEVDVAMLERLANKPPQMIERPANKPPQQVYTLPKAA